MCEKGANRKIRWCSHRKSKRIFTPRTSCFVAYAAKMPEKQQKKQELCKNVLEICAFLLSHPARGGRIEILTEAASPWEIASHPARGGRIEMVTNATAGQRAPTSACAITKDKIRQGGEHLCSLSCRFCAKSLTIIPASFTLKVKYFFFLRHNGFLHRYIYRKRKYRGSKNEE